MTYVHAFNNVLRAWGAERQTSQVNGMESGHAGFLVAEANFFRAGPLRESISVAHDSNGIPTANVTVQEGSTNSLRNIYKNKATPAQQVGTAIDINAVYDSMLIARPEVAAMDDKLRRAIEAGAGRSFK